MIREALMEVLGGYIDRKNESFGGNMLAAYLRQSASGQIETSASLDRSKYLVSGSPGQGVWAEVPWICVFDRSVTITAQKGLYLVYLFRADMTGVYLSLNQGFTFFKQRFGRDANSRISKVAEFARLSLDSSSGLSFDPIDLRGNGSLASGYEDGHICGIYYGSDHLPDEGRLVDDLRVMIGVYSELIGKFGGRTYEQFVSDVLSLPIQAISEEKDDVEYQRRVAQAEPSVTPRQPIEKPTPSYRNGRPYWPRDPSKANEAMVNVGYRCEADPNHLTFVSEVTGENFMECHHLIPIKA